MMKKGLLLVLLLIFNNSFCQVTFQKTYGYTSAEVAYNIYQTNDKGYILVGYTQSIGAGSSDVYVVKTDSMGNAMWSSTYGGIGVDEGNCIVQTNDSGYLILGRTYSFGAGGSDLYVIKTNSLGNIQWSKTYGGSNDDVGSSILKINDGYILTGTTLILSSSYNSRDVFLLRIDNNGDTLVTTAINSYMWTSTQGHNDWGGETRPTLDGNYIVTGKTFEVNNAYNQILNLKVDTNLNLIWLYNYHIDNNDFSIAIDATRDSGFIFCGGTGIYFFLYKIDSIGNSQWIKKYNGIAGESVFGFSRTSDYGYVITGNSDDYCFMIRTDSIGDTLWTRRFDGIGVEVGRSVIFNADSGFTIGGLTNSTGAGNADFYLIKTDSNGVSSPCNMTSDTISIVSTPVSGKINRISSVSNNCLINNSPNTIMTNVIVLGADVCLSTSIIKIDEKICNIYPNPAHNTFTISFNGQWTVDNGQLEVFDITGRKVMQQPIPGHCQFSTVNCQLKPGVYFIKVRGGEKVFTEKLVVE
jgi:hypothetical protein